MTGRCEARLQDGRMHLAVGDGSRHWTVGAMEVSTETCGREVGQGPEYVEAAGA
ncbi:hypothetical protein [Sphingomonas sp. T9W2]|uniref:hypothetical protein n=1 Tax=Sphingomonas sp. T9W2 TaxID=3143183 RepID=UPI0031F4E6CA